MKRASMMSQVLVLLVTLNYCQQLPTTGDPNLRLRGVNCRCVSNGSQSLASGCSLDLLSLPCWGMGTAETARRLPSSSVGWFCLLTYSMFSRLMVLCFSKN